MTRKKLLLVDLCARLPYGVKVYVEGDWFTDEREPYNTTIKASDPSSLIDFVNEECIIKPYLRPMSSMTKEERTEYLNACGNEMDNALSSPRYGGIDWLNAHHFDYRGLIPKGLALEAPEGMYNLK